MRLFFTLVCCLAMPMVAHAADQDNTNKKKKQGQGQQQQQQQGQSGKQGKHQGQGQGQGQQYKGKKFSQQGNLAQGQGQGQGKHHKEKNVSQQGNLAQGQGKHHKEKNVSQQGNLAQGQGKHHGKNAQANVQKAQVKHFNLANKPNPKIQSVTFQKNYHIEGAQNWKGQKYVVFRNYNCEWHDRGWWRSHYNRIVLISGGAYFWNAGFWFPAWGYDNAYSYYPYNGPIYAYNNLPPDQVIANVQAALQAQGYYRDGEVDGLLGRQTRAALADFQRDHGLYTTAAIDEPTLNSLGLS